MIELIEKEKPDGIWAGDMKDGDVAVIVKWDDMLKYVGRIVQRHGRDLITIGMPYSHSWPRSLENDRCYFSPTCRVRLLEKGEKLIVT